MSDNAPPDRVPASVRLALATTVALALVFVGGILVVPDLEREGAALGDWLGMGYHGLCHRLPERSLHVGDRPLAVCARCTGLYIGGVLGLVAGAACLVPKRRRPHPATLALAAAPTALDAVLPWLGLPGLPNLPRLVVSIPAGLVAGLFLALGVAEIFDTQRSDRASGPRVTAGPSALEGIDV